MADDSAFAFALMNSPEAVKVDIEVAQLRQERDRLRQRVDDLSKAREDLEKAEEALSIKVKEKALLIKAILSAMM